jgi:hypothetical protein
MGSNPSKFVNSNATNSLMQYMIGNGKNMISNCQIVLIAGGGAGGTYSSTFRYPGGGGGSGEYVSVEISSTIRNLQTLGLLNLQFPIYYFVGQGLMSNLSGPISPQNGYSGYSYMFFTAGETRYYAATYPGLYGLPGQTSSSGSGGDGGNIAGGNPYSTQQELLAILSQNGTYNLVDLTAPPRIALRTGFPGAAGFIGIYNSAYPNNTEPIGETGILGKFYYDNTVYNYTYSGINYNIGRATTYKPTPISPTNYIVYAGNGISLESVFSKKIGGIGGVVYNSTVNIPVIQGGGGGGGGSPGNPGSPGGNPPFQNLTGPDGFFSPGGDGCSVNQVPGNNQSYKAKNGPKGTGAGGGGAGYYPLDPTNSPPGNGGDGSFQISWF